jgi:hypothetical protein
VFLRTVSRDVGVVLALLMCVGLTTSDRHAITARADFNPSIPWCGPNIPQGLRISEETSDAVGIAAANEETARQPLLQAESVRSRFASDPTFGELWMLSPSHELIVAFARNVNGLDEELAPLMSGSAWTVRAVQVQYPQGSLDRLWKELTDRLSNKQLPADITMVTENPYLNRVVVMLANPIDTVASDVVERLPKDDRYCIDREPNTSRLLK